ncbi:MAG TPA: LysE family translocator [Candidatus Solibacter sp.]|nr:LysE family translocator [Candidatus Solibacter sp.]
MAQILDPSLLAFAGLALLLAVTPGPDMATVTRNGLAYGRRGVVLTALGIGTALLGWTAAGAVGVAAVLEASAVAFTAVKLAGACYLAYLGARSLLDSRHARRPDLRSAPLAPAGRIYRTGFLSAALNPKLGVFFVTLLPQFVRPGQPALARLLLLGAIFSVIGILWLAIYGVAVTKARDAIDTPRVRAWMERVSGVVLVGFAARLALERAR